MYTDAAFSKNVRLRIFEVEIFKNLKRSTFRNVLLSLLLFVLFLLNAAGLDGCQLLFYYCKQLNIRAKVCTMQAWLHKFVVQRYFTSSPNKHEHTSFPCKTWLHTIPAWLHKWPHTSFPSRCDYTISPNTCVYTPYKYDYTSFPSKRWPHIMIQAWLPPQVSQVNVTAHRDTSVTTNTSFPSKRDHTSWYKGDYRHKFPK